MLTSPTSKNTHYTDVRIIKTLKSIDEAFLTLLTTKAYDDIIVQDILDIAMVNRTTFYKYYDNKAELAIDIIERFKSSFFIPMIEQRFSASWDEFSKMFLPIYENYRNVLRVLWRIKTPKANLESEVYQLVKDKYIQHSCAKNHVLADKDLNFQAHIYASIYVALIDYNVAKDEPRSPDEVKANLKDIFTLMLN